MIRKNYHIFAWTNAVIGRVSREDVANAEIIDAAIELFRNGDVAITTNGVTTLSPRVLPFPHDGHGHDDEWVTANFTNATEILAQGYTNWVCAQVGDEEFPSLSLLVEVDETTLHSYFSHDWSGTGGDAVSLTASAFATIVSPKAEPVCNATTNVVEGGEAHEHAVNPCGVGVGRTGHFRVEVAPDSFPDDRIVWEKTGGLEFVGSCTGRCVSVRGVSAGAATLAVRVGDCLSDAPTFDVEVVQNVTVNIRAWIITGRLGEKPVKPEDVRRIVKNANDIYAQVGVSLNLVERHHGGRHLRRVLHL